MNDGYTPIPPLLALKQAWVRCHPFYATTSIEEREAEFDRAIASVARTAKAEAWAEGWNQGFRDTQAGEIEDGVMTITPTPNPYEQEPTP